ncbi:MAG TPA: alpha-galactosidase, partial [Tepidisphaeraceae bacterium]|nr:alpha-galactosidase [Tepidisphaeraceae bacterium]
NIACYRQDFNMDPLPEWRHNDAPDRQGMTEIQYVEGLYAYWDALLERFPGLIIDNCASGGRRIDLETISRSIPLWRSDWQCAPDNDPIGGQVHGMGLSYWVPLHGTGTYNSMTCAARCSTYRFRSSMAPALNFSVFPYEKTPIEQKYPWDWYRKMEADYLRARPLFQGDYYPLTDAKPDPRQWAAYQMHRPDLGEGFAMALRRRESPWTAAQLRLHGLEEGTTYELQDADTRRKRRVKGATLMQRGVEVTLGEVDSSCLLFYRAV